jgi:hypothetical protein
VDNNDSDDDVNRDIEDYKRFQAMSSSTVVLRDSKRKKEKRHQKQSRLCVLAQFRRKALFCKFGTKD